MHGPRRKKTPGRDVDPDPFNYSFAAGRDQYRNAGLPAIPDHDEDAFNAQDILSQQSLTSEEIYDEWEQSREVYKEAVEQIPLDFYPGDLLYPWGDERGTVAHLVETMVEHDIEHREEIATAIHSE